MNILEESNSIADWIIKLRRQFHRRPELMYNEIETSRLIRDTLDDLKINYRYPLATTGVVATIGTGKSPCVALRADIDALPIQEETDLPFRSEIDGKMHGCGHDCHIAMLLGAARLLKAHESELRGTVKFIFQPAEEGGPGAAKMCEEGALEDPKVDSIFGLHVWPGIKTGHVAGNSGVLLAAVGEFKIIVKGKGGHGALPHLTFDPITCAAKIIVELQTIVSREMNPFSPTVVSIGAIHGGNVMNVIPPIVEIIGTLRSLSKTDLEFVKQRIEKIAIGVAEVNRCKAELIYPCMDFPPTINDENCWKIAKQAAEELLGSEYVETMTPTLGGEDFAFYQHHVPGNFAFIGISDPTWKTTYGPHHPKFQVDEKALSIGTAWHVATTLKAISTALT